MIPVTTYKMLKLVVSKFKKGDVQSLMLVGPPGVGKSKTVENLFKKTPHAFIRGKNSAVQFYEDLLLHQNQPVVIDDAAGLLRDRDAEEILRDLADRDGVRTIRWNTQNKTFEAKGLPNRFQTTSRVCVLANTIGTGGVWEALRSRFQVMTVDLSWAEVCKFAAKQKVITDQEILNFAESHARIKPSLRALELAEEAKTGDLYDWRQQLTQPVATNPGMAVASLLSTPGISNNARSKMFAASGRGRATFYRYLKKQRQAAPPRNHQIKNALEVMGCLSETRCAQAASPKKKKLATGCLAKTPARRATKKKIRTAKTSRRGKRGAA